MRFLTRSNSYRLPLSHLTSPHMIDSHREERIISQTTRPSKSKLLIQRRFQMTSKNPPNARFLSSHPSSSSARNNGGNQPKRTHTAKGALPNAGFTRKHLVRNDVFLFRVWRLFPPQVPVSFPEGIASLARDQRNLGSYFSVSAFLQRLSFLSRGQGGWEVKKRKVTWTSLSESGNGARSGNTQSRNRNRIMTVPFSTPRRARKRGVVVFLLDQ